MADIPLPPIGDPVHILPRETFLRSGVYFLLHDGEVVYVGQAQNMRQRIGQHLAEGIKLFDSVSCIPCSHGKLTQTERFYITAYAPRYNACSIAKEAKSFAKRGLPQSVNYYSQQLVDAKTAAHMLGVSENELKHFRNKGLRLIQKRVPRSNVKRKLYDVASIRDIVEAA